MPVRAFVFSGACCKMAQRTVLTSDRIASRSLPGLVAQFSTPDPPCHFL